MKSRLTVAEKVAARFVVDATSGCWRWTGSLNDSGYGLVYNEGRQRRAHRVTYELYRGAVPEGLWLDHQCHNRDKSCVGGRKCPHRRCVNPDHLEPATNRENAVRGRAADSVRARNAERTHCKNGHELTPDNVHVNAKGHRGCRACHRDWTRRRVGLKRKGSCGPLREILRRECQVAWLSCGHVITLTNSRRTARCRCFLCNEEIHGGFAVIQAVVEETDEHPF